MKQIPSRRSTLYRRTLVVFGAILIAISFMGYGVLVGKYRFFPYTVIAEWKQTFAPLLENTIVESVDANVSSNFVTFDKKTYNYLNELNLVGHGGGVAVLQHGLLGVDKEGHFFTYGLSDSIKLLNISLPTNEGAFRKYLAENVSDQFHKERIDRYFRVMDLEVVERNGKLEIYVSHNFWDEKNKAKSIRLSRMVVDGVDALTGRVIGVDMWEAVFETSPPISFTEETPVRPDDPFRSNRGGGSIAYSEPNRLYFAIGDNQYDGLANADLVQNGESNFGKIYQIDLDTLESRRYALGVRNSQGLIVDESGRLWEAEHGPEGGDELNLILEGNNYGWPKVTFGTNYESKIWPLSSSQGRHKGFRHPVFAWVPSIAPSSLIQVKNVPRPWDGDLLLASLHAQSLFRIHLNNDSVVVIESVPIGARIRDLAQMVDGTLVLWTDDARLIVLRPVTGDADSDEVELADLPPDISGVIQTCLECHTLGSGSSHRISLRGIVGEDVASAGYQSYSAALKNVGGKWTREKLSRFLEDVNSVAPGTSMPNPHISDEETRIKLVDFLDRLGD